MEGVLELVPPLEVVAHFGGGGGVGQGAQASRTSSEGRRQRLDQRRFEQAPHEVDLRHLVGAEANDEVAAVVVVAEQAFGGECLERFADGDAAGARGDRPTRPGGSARRAGGRPGRWRRATRWRWPRAWRPPPCAGLRPRRQQRRSRTAMSTRPERHRRRSPKCIPFCVPPPRREQTRALAVVEGLTRFSVRQPTGGPRSLSLKTHDSRCRRARRTPLPAAKSASLQRRTLFELVPRRIPPDNNPSARLLASWHRTFCPNAARQIRTSSPTNASHGNP